MGMDDRQLAAHIADLSDLLAGMSHRLKSPVDETEQHHISLAAHHIGQSLRELAVVVDGRANLPTPQKTGSGNWTH